MLRLAVATRAETYERIEAPLRKRGVEIGYANLAEGAVALADPTVESFDAGLVYPGRIPEGGVIDALLSVPWVNDRESILRSRHKAEALARLARADVPIPETVMLSSPVDEADLRTAFERFDPPVVVKPNSTTRGTGIAKVHDLDSLLGVADYLSLLHDFPATGDRSFLLQEYLPDARDYRAMVVDGRYAGAVERRLPERALAGGGWKHNVHRGAEATGAALPEDLRRLAEDAAAAIGIPYLGVDLLVTDDRAVVNETNARPTVDDETKYEPGFYDDLAGLIRRTAERGR
ncbi:RimK family alpha-L-glutamate ligase [Halomarina halobia]|uniref:RimK family alpha-L-glutamate ligase n=1 Tax=Halomarina halobia TaxID=3033386 RepID=A0ABD6ABF4_9EURY|nr:RimK family alpha-L-glutamate ligase [Halomarina sp. PSR21]